MNYLDLFHGIGGFALGAYWAGMKFENHYCSDIDPYCQKLYSKRFPDSIQLGDITKINTADLPKGDWIISGGFPCQDISIAGKGEGIYGTRSGLWFEYWKIINNLRPRFAIVENVGEFLRRGLREVLGGLSEIGYDAEWQCISASNMGAPHKRERVWIVAYPGRKLREERLTAKIQGRSFRGTVSIYNQSGGEGSHREGWATEPGMDRVAHGVPNSVDRLKGLGNAVVPQIAELLFRQIKEISTSGE